MQNSLGYGVPVLFIFWGALIGQARGEADKTEVPSLPWNLAKTWHLRVERKETGETNLNDREIWYKDRGPAESKFQVNLSRDPKDPSRALIFVPDLTRKSEMHDREQLLRIDARFYDLREDGKRVKILRSNGTEKEKRALLFLTRKPWYALKWGGKAWSGTSNLAKDEAWPLADGLALDRELAILLPGLSSASAAGALKEKASFQRTVLLPYPVPLTPALTLPIHYRVSRTFKEDDREMIALEFSGTLNNRPSAGVTWGGISMKNVAVAAQLAGEIEVDLRTFKLKNGSLRLNTSLHRAGSGESFESEWNLHSSWKPARDR